MPLSGVRSIFTVCRIITKGSLGNRNQLSTGHLDTNGTSSAFYLIGNTNITLQVVGNGGSMVQKAMPVRVNRDSRLNKIHKVKQLDKPVKRRIGWTQNSTTEPMVLRGQLHELNKEIKLLKQRKATIQKRLLEMGQNLNVRSSYFKKPIILYVLKLEGGNYYIGTTRNLDKRYKEHCTGKGSEWTRIHKPIEILEARETGLTDDREACLLEDELTLEMAEMHGPDFVRGGGYCQKKPRWPSRITFPKFS